MRGREQIRHDDKAASLLAPKGDDGRSSDTDTINFTKNIAVAHGLVGDKADTVALRSHAGTQYLQYILGGLQVLDAISYLQSQIDPSGKRRIDPYVLFACGLNNPSREGSYVNRLRACMELQ